jgi:hypothetical protein
MCSITRSGRQACTRAKNRAGTIAPSSPGRCLTALRMSEPLRLTVIGDKADESCRSGPAQLPGPQMPPNQCRPTRRASVPKAIPQASRPQLCRILDSGARRTWLVDFMHGAQRVCRLCRQAKLPGTGPADELYAQFLDFAGMVRSNLRPSGLTVRRAAGELRN